ncbi:type-F conjugative transfer system secretin TraK [Roseateles chitinivorans]|uniref:type-F conjugative transfer system secretin TraK n=1 Tax=Roseateles chitinivorans TaxID=2917965 RepID=UPI003D674108
MALSLALHAHALQVLEAIDGVAVQGVISIKEPTRIRIEGGAITDVVGNIFSTRCAPPPAGPMASGRSLAGFGNDGAALPGSPTVPSDPNGTAGPVGVGPGNSIGPISPFSSGSPISPISPVSSVTPINPGGDVVLECDPDKGEVYVRPVGVSDKPINLFVSSATATYTLILTRADTPADTVLIRDKTPLALRRFTRSTPTTSGMPQAASPSPSHVRAMKALLVAMASDRIPTDMRVDETPRLVPLWTGVKFSLLRVYEGRGLTGEQYSLQNVNDLPIVLAEQEFDRPAASAGGEVTGVAIERHALQPGESTLVYVIRRGGAR